ncbi:MAG: FAD:protein FMN transferase [Flavobacterium sp.]
MKLLSFLITLIFCNANAQVAIKRDTVLMGSRFDITIVATDSTSAEKNINQVIDEITRIENLISEWKPSSQVSEVNRNAGIKSVKVDKELFNLTKRALAFSEITNGAFDISIAAMDKIWKFDGSMEKLPSQEILLKAIEKVGYKNIELNEKESTIFLKLTGMKIGFGATGKGYAADQGRLLMQQLNVNAGIVNASGDMATWGTQPDNAAWRIGITNPLSANKSLKIIEVNNAAITTSGDYEKYVEFNDKRYSHIINPKTGMPASGLISVTVIGENAETANGLSTSIMVLGHEKGLELLKNYPDYACLILTDKGKVKKSKNFNKILKSLR